MTFWHRYFLVTFCQGHFWADFLAETLFGDFLVETLLGDSQAPVTMFKLLQAVRPNPLYSPGGVENFWKVAEEDDDRKAAKAEDSAVPRNDLSIDTRKEEGMKGFERTGSEKGKTDAWRNGTASFQPVFKRGSDRL